MQSSESAKQREGGEEARDVCEAEVVVLLMLQDQVRELPAASDGELD